MGLELNVPGAHCLQVPFPLSVHPRLHVQPRKLPGARVFAGHCIQVLLSMSNDNPLLQMQFISAVLAADEEVLCGQLIQLEFPLSDLYVFS